MSPNGWPDQADSASRELTAPVGLCKSSKGDIWPVWLQTFSMFLNPCSSFWNPATHKLCLYHYKPSSSFLSSYPLYSAECNYCNISLEFEEWLRFKSVISCYVGFWYHVKEPNLSKSLRLCVRPHHNVIYSSQFLLYESKYISRSHCKQSKK